VSTSIGALHAKASAVRIEHSGSSALKHRRHADDEPRVTRRLLATAACALVLAGPAAASGSWAQPQIVAVTAKGLMGGDASAFRPDDPLTRAELADLVRGLTGKPAPIPPDPTQPATIAQLDAQLVRALGLLPVARQFSAGARAASLAPPRWFGTEVVARLLGLRVNHPAGEDDLELGPSDAATRAEAAYSAARILRFAGGEVDFVTRLATTFQLPPVSALQRRVLQTAISLVGYPYVWGGTSERRQRPFGASKELPGGFDCSGFVWRVYKLQAYVGAGALARTLKGRTTYAMSGEVPRALRISLTDLEPGDVVFFGPHGSRSKPTEIDHAGIYLGGGWFVHSSDEGVALAPLTGGYATRFAWARRPLAEAGLE
jgi:cell wall-associated NlpC family hydrolase